MIYDRSPHRTRSTYRCLGCGKEFHPNKASDRLYCSNQCRSDAVSARGRTYRRVEDGAKDGTLTPEEIVATLRAIRREPLLVVEEPEGEDG